MNQSQKIIAEFKKEVEQLKQCYARAKDPADLTSGIRTLAANKDYHPFVDALVRLGNSYIEDGDSPAGFACIKAAGMYFPRVNNKTLYYLRMAQYHIENGDSATGVDYLTRICKTYGECCDMLMELQKLSALWAKYRPLVAHLIPEPELVPIEPFLRSPQKPTRSIADILAQPSDDLLTDLSAHLNEMSANGEYLNSLNKWERTIWYADELCMEVNSGGFEGYLYYHGTHFEKAYKAISDMGAPNVTALLDAVRAKFPRARIPGSEAAIQNAMDKLEDKGVDFEDQDDIYYTSAERELLSRMTAWVRANSKHFR